MTGKTTLDKSKLLGFDAKGDALFDSVVPEGAQDAAQSRATGAPKVGIVKADGTAKAAGGVKLVGGIKV